MAVCFVPTVSDVEKMGVAVAVLPLIMWDPLKLMAQRRFATKRQQGSDINWRKSVYGSLDAR